MKIKVPEGMLKAATEAHCHFKVSGPGSIVEATLEAALRWLSENPIVPTNDWIKMYAIGDSNSLNWLRDVIHEWQRRMFCAPATEVPEAIKDLLEEPPYIIYQNREDLETVLKRHRESQAKILEAYRRGIRAAEVTQLEGK